MTASLETARDEIIALLKSAWDANPDSQDVPLFYWDVPDETPTEDQAQQVPSWARVSVQHTWGSQASISGDSGKRRWLRQGMVSVQIFTAVGDGLSMSDKLTMVAMRAFEGQSTPSGVWFRYVQPYEVGQEGVWFQTNVKASFEYDEVR